MKQIKPDGSPAFQGDLVFRRVEKLPPSAVKQAHTGEAIVGHSETQHHHVAVGTDFDWYTMPGDAMRAWLVARAPVQIEHRRSTDTHETFELGVGGGEVVWEIGRQREYVPDGWRLVAD